MLKLFFTLFDRVASPRSSSCLSRKPKDAACRPLAGIRRTLSSLPLPFLRPFDKINNEPTTYQRQTKRRHEPTTTAVTTGPRPASYPHTQIIKSKAPPNPLQVYAMLRRLLLSPFACCGARRSSPLPPARRPARGRPSRAALVASAPAPLNAQRPSTTGIYALERFDTRPVPAAGLPPPTCVPRREERRVSQPELPEAEPELE